MIFLFKQRNRNLLLAVALLSVWWASLLAGKASATTEYSCQTGQACSYCHERPEGGGTLTPCVRIVVALRGGGKGGGWVVRKMVG